MNINEAMGTNYKLVVIGGKEYKLAPVSVSLLRKAEAKSMEKAQRQKAQDIKELNALKADIPEDIYNEQMRKIVGRVVSTNIEDNLNNSDGIAYIMFLALNKYQPEITQEFFEDLTDEDLANLAQAMFGDRLVTGTDKKKEAN